MTCTLCLHTHYINICTVVWKHEKFPKHFIWTIHQVVYIVESAYSFSMLSLSLQLNLSASICMGCLQRPFWQYDRQAGDGKTQTSKIPCCLIWHWFFHVHRSHFSDHSRTKANQAQVTLKEGRCWWRVLSHGNLKGKASAKMVLKRVVPHQGVVSLRGGSH